MDHNFKKVLITGGAGFIGSHLVDWLIKDGCKVAVVDDLSTGKKENLNPGAKFYKNNVLDAQISGIFCEEKPEIVFHYAAQISIVKSVENPIEDARANILGALNVLECCRKHGTKKIIFASSGGAIYGDADIIPTPETCFEAPNSPYGIAKLSVEKYLNYYCQSFGLSFASLRLANVYGPRQNSAGEAGVVAIFCDRMLFGKDMTIHGDGGQTRDFVFIDDVVRANILAMKNDKQRSGIFNVGTGKETDINAIFGKLRKLTNSSCKESHDHSKIGGQKRSCLDSSLAWKELGWRPKYSPEEGLEKTVEWFEKYGRIV